MRPSLTIFVHVLYRSGSEAVTTSLADGFVSEPRTGSISEVASFAAAGARIIQRTSGAYLTDFPRLKADLAFSEAGTLSPSLRDNWQIVKLTTSCQSRAGVQSFCLLPRRQALPALRSMCPAIEQHEPELIQFRVIARRSEPDWVEVIPKFTLGHVSESRLRTLVAELDLSEDLQEHVTHQSAEGNYYLLQFLLSSAGAHLAYQERLLPKSGRKWQVGLHDEWLVESTFGRLSQFLVDVALGRTPNPLLRLPNGQLAPTQTNQTADESDDTEKGIQEAGEELDLRSEPILVGSTLNPIIRFEFEAQFSPRFVERFPFEGEGIGARSLGQRVAALSQRDLETEDWDVTGALLAAANDAGIAVPVLANVSGELNRLYRAGEIFSLHEANLVILSRFLQSAAMSKSDQATLSAPWIDLLVGLLVRGSYVRSRFVESGSPLIYILRKSSRTGPHYVVIDKVDRDRASIPTIDRHMGDIRLCRWLSVQGIVQAIDEDPDPVFRILPTEETRLGVSPSLAPGDELLCSSVGGVLGQYAKSFDRDRLFPLEIREPQDLFIQTVAVAYEIVDDLRQVEFADSESQALTIQKEARPTLRLMETYSLLASEDLRFRLVRDLYHDQPD